MCHRSQHSDHVNHPFNTRMLHYSGIVVFVQYINTGALLFLKYWKPDIFSYSGDPEGGADGAGGETETGVSF